MGEVYLAEDTHLGRQIALKVLPPSVANDPERLARFEREARAVAALNHPNIVTLHSVEKVEDIHFLTMERVEGQTLTEQIPPGGLPLDELLQLAISLADAMATAHQHGIIHRDLKPGNVMVTPEGRLKLLDFGLAKLRPRGEDEAATMTAADELTEDGRVLGTVAYMAPEQVRGEPADARSDIFALGCILYELATGRRPFDGATGPELVSSILRDHPPRVDEVRPDLPRHLGRLVSLCLKKRREDRLQSALDLRNELRELQAERVRDDALRSAAPGPAPSASPAPDRRRLVLWAGLGVLLAVAAGWMVWILLTHRDGGLEERREQVAEGAVAGEAGRTRLAQLTFGDAIEEWPAWSPSGQQLVYSAEVDGFMNLFLRDLESGEVTRLTRGPRDDVQAAWGPEGDDLLFVRSDRPDSKLERTDVHGYFARAGEVWRLDLASGTEQRLFSQAFHPAVSPDGEAIAFDASWAGPQRIWIADRRGRNPRQLTTDISEQVAHTAPHWSPDGDRLVFRIVQSTRSDIGIATLGSGAHERVTDDEFTDLEPVWGPGGDSIYFPSYRGGGMNLWRLTLGSDGAATGPPEQLTTGAGQDVQPVVSPDGSRLAFVVLQLNSDLWRVPLDPATGRASGEPEEWLSTTREESRGAWSPDQRRVAFNSDRAGEMNLFVRALDGGAIEQVTTGPGGDYQPQWSPDGKRLVFFSSRSGTADIWSVNLDDGRLEQLTNDPGLDLDPFYSPDGQRIAFHSDRSGRLEVWVMNSDGGELRQLTTEGATSHFLRWSVDGSRIFFATAYSTSPVEGPPNLLAVDVTTEAVEPLLHVASGGHISFSPDHSLLLDAVGHRTLWIYPMDGSDPYPVFAFDDPEIRIDYPGWSPDGRWVIFDRGDPRGGDIWLLEGIER